jgi:excisionase family DNA binding protein
LEDNIREGFGYCDYHEETVEEETYCWKGCWGCHHFQFGQAFPYTFVTEASEVLKVSASTVRRMIKKGKLEGELFEQQRRNRSLPSPAKYHILKKSLREFLKSQTVAKHELTESARDTLLQKKL